MLETIWLYSGQIIAALYLPIAIGASVHVVLRKEDERAAIAWVGLIWLSPLIGAVLYWLFGINRIQRKAVGLKANQPDVEVVIDRGLVSEGQLASVLGKTTEQYRPLIKLVNCLTDRPLMRGNWVAPLVAGDEAYPAMLKAIESASSSIALSSYIFDNDRAGAMFRDALAGAVRRGVEVRVLIDDIGSRYTWPPIVRSLRKAGIPTARFLPSLLGSTPSYTNLRNHRKLLVVDGALGFTGGMNIREGNFLDWNTRHPIHDLHFKMNGPVVVHLLEAFNQDWAFTTGEILDSDAWQPRFELAGNVLARGISDGPDEDYDKLRLTLMSALAVARRRVAVVTPYFLPDDALLTSLSMAAKRGVRVQVILPEVNNLRLMQWASTAMYPRVLAQGCEIWLTSPPFDHSKLMLVDDEWALVGSANWDARSLRLNFEFNVECYDRGLVASLDDMVAGKLRDGRRLEMDELEQRWLPLRIRDNVARLASPYL